MQDLHAAVLKLAAGEEHNIREVGEAIDLLTATHGEISKLLRSMPGISLPDLGKLDLVKALRVLVADEIGVQFDGVSWDCSTESEEAFETLSQLEQEVLYYASREAMRNAARHGRQGDDSRTMNLRLMIRTDHGFEIGIEDDGVGILSSNEQGKNGGQGLSLHSTMMAVIGGTLQVESEPGKFTRVVLWLPGR